MDSIYFAVAGIALFVIGTAGLVAVLVFFVGATIRYEVAPRISALVAWAAAGGRDWITPPERPRPGLVAARTPSSRR